MRKPRTYSLHHRPGAIVIKVNGAVRVLVPYEHDAAKTIATGLPPRSKAENFAKEITLLLRQKEAAREDEMTWRDRMK